MHDGGASTITTRRQRASAIVELDRPDKLNAFTPAMVQDLRLAVDAAADDSDVFGIVITGSGRAFCAGLDTGDLARAAEGGLERPDPDPHHEVDEELPALFGHLLSVPKPVIGAINGVAAGGGFVLAMMCDLRFAAPEAAFVTAFARRGLIAEHGTSWFLPRLVGTSTALDLLWSSRRVHAPEAARIGLVDRLVDDGDVVEAAVAYIDELAATVSPRSVASIKALVHRGASQTAIDALREAEQAMHDSLAHPDAKEGVESFVARRPPRFAPLSGGGA